MESDPDAPYAVAVTVAVDAQERVAVLDEGGAEIVPGPLLGDLAQALAEECRADVAFGDVVAEAGDDAGRPTDRAGSAGNAVAAEEIPAVEAPDVEAPDVEAPDVEAPDDDPFDPEIDVEIGRVPDRSVVLTSATASGLESLATATDTRLTAMPFRDGHLVLIEDGPVLTELEWHQEHLPVVALEQGDVFPSVTVIDAPGRAHLFTWDAHLEAVPAEPAAAGVVHPFIDAELGTGALVRALMRAVPAAEPAGIRAALEGPSDQGPRELASALGLPDLAGAFLAQEAPASDLVGAHVYEPVGVAESLRRAVTGAAEGVFEGVFNGEYHLPGRPSRSWTTPVIAGAELALGALAVQRAGRSGRNGGSATVGERALGLTGALLLVDAVVNVTVVMLPWLRRSFPREPGER